MNILKFIIHSSHLSHEEILSPWKWLIGEDKEIMVITKMGDLVLKDPSHKLYFLSTCTGSMEHLSNYSNDFLKNRLSAEQYYEIFLPELIEELEQDGKQLKEDEVFSFLKLPIMGGKNEISNIHCTNVYEHFNSTGRIHKQMDELTEDSIKIE